MNASPFLPPLSQPGVSLFTEANDLGAKFVEVTEAGYATLNAYQNTAASPYFGAVACAIGGAVNPDAQCLRAGSPLSSPFVTHVTKGIEWEFASPFELLPLRR
jgi:hypothetical protein